jgi:CheY-like chemotaxis protein
MDGAADDRGRILLVEDDPVSAAYVLHVLRNRGGFAVIHATGPAEALRQATAARDAVRYEKGLVVKAIIALVLVAAVVLARLLYLA